MSIHPLHRLSLAILLAFSLTYVFLNLITYQPEEIESVSVHCIHRFENAKATDIPAVSEEAQFQVNLVSWDLSTMRSDQLNRAIQYLQGLIEYSSLPQVIQLQGVQPWMKSRLKSLLLDRGGCWSYAALWSTPTWLRGTRIYESLFGQRYSQETTDQGLWTAIVGKSRILDIAAERWSLPPRPGRWPQRLLHVQPAALSFKVRWRSLNSQQSIKNTQSTQVINISLADTVHKHQAGALALQKLTRPPLVQHFRPPWLIFGDWRVNPPQTPPHPIVGYRFQRFSLEGLEDKFVTLFNNNTPSAPWGRWRLSEETPTSVIDHAYASQGTFELYPHLNLSLPWLGGEEQRAPLFVKWIIGKP